MKWSIASKAVLIVFVIVVASKGYAAEAMNAEFKTLNECLEGIKKSSGQSLKVVTDKPTQVSGFLANGQGFACNKKETGTKGTYYHGWYLVK